MTEAAAAPPEVTIVANDIGPAGGMERQLTVLITALLEAGHRVRVIAWTCNLPPHPNLRWFRVPGPSRPFSLAYPLFLVIASLLVARRRRGVLHSTGAIVLNRTDVNTVHFCHHAAGAATPGLSRASRPGPAYRANAWVVRRLNLLAERWCFRPRRTRHLIGVSNGLASELRDHFPAMADRIGVIPNGVDTDRFHPRDAVGAAAMAESARPAGRSQGAPAPERLRALFVGGDWERKGLRLAIEALAGCPAAELTVVGDGDAGGYRDLARGLGCADRVHFAGPTDDTAPAYRAADAFLLPTAYESFSLVTYEAAASGLPLLVTPVNGVEDLLRDGANGWFIDRSPDSIAARLRTLATDPSLRRTLGETARRDSLAYSWSSVVQSYRDLYARCT